MRIESKKIVVNEEAEHVFAYLHDLNNLESLMPEDKIENWESSEETCSFRIKGMTAIGMKRTGATEYSEIQIVSEGKNPFTFTWNLYVEAGEGNCMYHSVFDADANPMIKMMAETPLTNFFNILAENLRARFN